MLIPDATIVIPSFNGLHLLKTCLQSIGNQGAYAFEVVLVDNGSEDGTSDWVKRHYPKIEIIRFNANKGFSVAVNEGIRRSSGRYIFLLNNDTELGPDCLEIMIQTADANGGYASFAPKMIQYHNRKLLDGAGDGVFRGGGGYRLGTREPDGALWDHPVRVFGACAGAALYCRVFFEEAGKFDEDFFAYLEDVDINFRAARLGLRCLYVPGARVYHMGSQTSGSSLNTFTACWTTQNMIRVVVHNYPLSILLRQWPVIMLHHFGWLILMILRRQFPSYIKGIRAAFYGFPVMLKKRNRWRTRKTVSDSEFWDMVVRSEKDILDSALRRRGFHGQSSRLIRLYMKIFHGMNSGKNMVRDQ
ncbi:MAG: glycosyltransferase family 2 protein [Deltaproteobacteria bacterium]|nr:glycosyltransferase family 2 protein [Deltaproteobacteria bacterium]